MKKTLITALMVFVLLAPLFFSACGSDNNIKEGFAIYLTQDDVSPAQMEILSHVDMAKIPVVASRDIVSYTWDTHEIELTSEAFKKLDTMQVPTSGISFIICVDEVPLYWGAFWAGYSSQSFDGVTIWTKPTLAGENRIQITMGYPSLDFYKGDDPRSNLIIRESLEKAGKLK
jgi:hypothetical protein